MVAETTFPLILTVFWSAVLLVIVIRWRRMATKRAMGNSLMAVGWLLYSMINLSQPQQAITGYFVTALAVLAWIGAVVLLYQDLQDATTA